MASSARAPTPKSVTLLAAAAVALALSGRPCGASGVPTALDRALRAADVLQQRFYHAFAGTWKCPVFSDSAAAAAVELDIPAASGSFPAADSGAALTNDKFTGADQGSWWNCANSLEALANTVAYTQNSTYLEVLHHVWEASSVFYLEHKLTAGLDDIEWWALAWIRVAEVTRDSQYLKRSIGYFEEATKYWDNSTCKGGVWWDRKRTYKNAITNELFMMLAVRLYRATKDEQYLIWARRSWDWFKDSGLINSDNLVNDGLDGSCKNNGGETWTYNQGVILGALAELFLAEDGRSSSSRSSSEYLAVGLKIADAVMHQKLAAGLLHESCEPKCNDDGKQFKGIFVRYLAYFAQALPPPNQEKRAKYQGFIAQNAETLWRKDQDSSGAFGVTWNGPASSVDAISHTSGLDATNAELVLQVSPPGRLGAVFSHTEDALVV